MEVDEDTPKYVRTKGDLKEMIKHAKLEERSLTEVSQAIYFPDVTDYNNLRLLELDSHLLHELEAGNVLELKGGLNEKVVLCTATKTYEIKEAEISNLLLVVPDLMFAQATSKSPLKSPTNGLNHSGDRSLETDENVDGNGDEDLGRTIERREVKKVFHDYLECREIKPRFKKISDLLSLTRYSGVENEYCVDRKNLFTFDQLLNTSQCSRAEFQAGLQRYRALDITGYMRLLQFDYEIRVVFSMLNLLSENSWKLSEVDKEITFSLLDDIYPTEILNGLFDLYTEPVTEGTSSATPKYRYREDMVCKIIAQNILQPGLKFRIDDFLSTWQGELPEGMKIDEKYLQGIGIVDRESSSPSVQSLYEENLPTNLADRLRYLFKKKEKWSAEQIQPYIEYFTTPQLGVTAILAKHARSLMINGVRYYVSKH